MRYLFDSDVLIGAARLHYSPMFCEAFWAWIVAGHKAGYFYSIDKVKDELLDGDEDPLQEWSKQAELADFFNASLPSIAQWKILAIEATKAERGFKEGAKVKFLNLEKADAWLISYAAHHKNFTIVTNEVSAPESKKEIKLPDASKWLGVKTITLPALLRSHAITNFTLQDPSPIGAGVRKSTSFRNSSRALP